MFWNKAVVDAGLSGKPMSKTVAQIEKPYSSFPPPPSPPPLDHIIYRLHNLPLLSEDHKMTTQEFEMSAWRSLFVPRLMFLNTCLTCTMKYILIWLQTFLTLEISSIYPPHVPIHTYFNKGCFGNRALVSWKPLFGGHSSKALHCILRFIMTKSQSNLYWNRCILFGMFLHW